MLKQLIKTVEEFMSICKKGSCFIFFMKNKFSHSRFLMSDSVKITWTIPLKLFEVNSKCLRKKNKIIDSETASKTMHNCSCRYFFSFISNWLNLHLFLASSFSFDCVLNEDIKKIKPDSLRFRYVRVAFKRHGSK